MAVAEEDDQVDFELDLEASRGDGGAREEAREDHVYRDRPAVAHGAVCNLNVLDLGRLDRGLGVRGQGSGVRGRG